MITRNSRSSLWLGGVLLGRITTALAASIACNTLQAPFTYTATLPCFAHPINYCVSNSRDHVAGFKPPMYHRSSFNVQRCSSRPTDRKKTRQCNALVLHMTAVNDDQSNSEGDFNSSEAEFERRLELDAQAWAGGDPGRLQWWESAKAWRRREKMRQVRAEAMSELERDKLRYVLSDVQRLTGLPLVDNDKNKIKPLAWFMTIVIQLMPIALVFVIFDALHPMGDTEPVQVFDMTRPFWS